MIGLCAVCCVLCAASGASLQVQAGLGSYGRRGCWVPIRVAVANVQEPIDGLLELQQDEATVTATAVSLVPGSTKQYTLYLLLETVNEFSPAFTLGVRLRQGRRVLVAQSVRLQLVDPSNRLLVTATGEGTGLQALHGVALSAVGWKIPEAGREGGPPVAAGFTVQGGPVAEGVVQAAQHPPATLPERWNGYQAADLVVLTGPVWATLSAPQRQALRRWVETGGRAILCGEQPGEWADPEARQLLPGSLRSQTPDARRQAPVNAVRPSPLASGAWRLASAILAIVPRRDAEAILRTGDDVVACAGRAGFGVVVWVGFDPFRSTTRLSPGYRRLWRTLIGRATGFRSDRPVLSDLFDVPAASRAAGALAQMPAPSRTVLIGIAITYVLIFGPLNIRILRRLRRTVKAWLFLPSLAVLMTVVLLTMGQSWGRSRALSNRVTVTETMSDASTGWESDLVGLFSPTNLAFHLEISDPCLALRPEETEDEKRDAGAGASPGGFPPGYPGGSTEFRRPRSSLVPALQLEDRSRWERLPLTLWSVQYQQFRRPIDLDGTVSLTLRERVPDRPEGWVRNGTAHPMTRAYLQYRGRRHALGNLEPGAARRVGSEGWVRRLTQRASAGGASLPPDDASGSRPGRSAPESPGRIAGGWTPGVGGKASDTRSEAIADLYEDAPVFLRMGSREDEAVLVAEAPALRVPVAIEGVPEVTRASLLLVRAPVGR